MHMPEHLAVEQSAELSGFVDDVKKLVGGAVRIIDRIREGGRIVIQPPGFPSVELDTRDPNFFNKLREIINTIKGSVRFETGARVPTMPETVGSQVARFVASPVGAGVLLGGLVLVAALLTRGRR